MNDNPYWYLGLSLISVMLLIYICVIRKVTRSFLLFLIMVEIAFLIETVIYIFLGSYVYHPEILKYGKFYDSSVGASTSNLLVIPILGTFVATFRLRWWGIAFFIGLLGGMEWLFIKLDIYTQYWWRTEYTMVGLVFYFWAAILLYRRLLQPAKGWLHSLFLYLCTAPLVGMLHIFPIILLLNRYYDPGWFADRSHDTTAFESIYYVCSSLAIVAVVRLRLRWRWLAFILLFAFHYSVDLVLMRVGILDSRTWWDPWYYSLFPSVVYLISEEISKRLSKGPMRLSKKVDS